MILRDLRVLAVLPTGTDSSLCSLRLPDDLPTGSSFGSGDGAGNRTRHARRTSSAMENATADRSGRSKRRREPWRLANGAISGPGVCGRTATINRPRQEDASMPPDVNAARLHRLVRGLRSWHRWTTVGQSAERHPTARPRRWQAFFFRVPRPGIRTGPAIAVTTRFRARSRTFSFAILGLAISARSARSPGRVDLPTEVFHRKREVSV